MEFSDCQTGIDVRSFRRIQDQDKFWEAAGQFSMELSASFGNIALDSTDFRQFEASMDQLSETNSQIRSHVLRKLKSSYFCRR